MEWNIYVSVSKYKETDQSQYYDPGGTGLLE